jgi:hypothetical protein
MERHELLPTDISLQLMPTSRYSAQLAVMHGKFKGRHGNASLTSSPTPSGDTRLLCISSLCKARLIDGQKEEFKNTILKNKSQTQEKQLENVKSIDI